MKRTFVCALSIILTLGLIGCTAPASAEVLKSDKDRITSPEVGLSDLATLIEGNNQFAFKKPYAGTNLTIYLELPDSNEDQEGSTGEQTFHSHKTYGRVYQFLQAPLNHLFSFPYISYKKDCP